MAVDITVCACWLFSWLGFPVAAFWFCGWYHVFTQWALWCIISIPKWQEHSNRSYFIVTNQLLLNDKDQQVHIVVCAWGQSLLSIVTLFTITLPWSVHCITFALHIS